MKANADDINLMIEKQLKDEAMAILRQIVSEISETKEFIKAKNTTIARGLALWGNHNKMKKMISKRMARKFNRESRNADVLPDTKIEELSLWANIGKLVTLGARYMAQMDKTNPNRLADIMEKPVKDILENTDFGNLYEMTAVSDTRIMATRQMLQDVVNEFPAKTGILPAMKLKKANTAIKKKNLSLAAMEDMPPEMLVGTMVNLVNALIDTKEVTTLLNHLSELIRKIHTGNVIQGEGGKSLIEMTLTEKLNDSLPEMDPVVFRKAVVGAFESVEAVNNSVITALADNPKMLEELVAAYGLVKNSAIRKKRKKAELFEDFFEEEDHVDLAVKHLAEIDGQELGEVVNTWLHILNTLHDAKPEAVLEPVASLMTSLDWDELQEAAQWMVPGLVQAVKPSANAFMPSVIKGLCDLLTPSPGEDTDDLEEALDHLKNILSSNGGQTS